MMGEHADNLRMPNDANMVASRIMTALGQDDDQECIISAKEVIAMAVALTNAYDILTGFCGDERFSDGELDPMFQVFHTPVEEGETT